MNPYHSVQCICSIDRIIWYSVASLSGQCSLPSMTYYDCLIGTEAHENAPYPSNPPHYNEHTSSSLQKVCQLCIPQLKVAHEILRVTDKDKF